MFRSIFNKIKQGLAKTRSLFGSVAELFGLRGRVDQKFLDELEKRLYLADVGTFGTQEIVKGVRQAFLDKEVSGDVKQFVKDQLRSLLTDASPGLRYQPSGPTVVMV